jgi:hypothetical protein
VYLPSGATVSLAISRHPSANAGTASFRRNPASSVRFCHYIKVGFRAGGSACLGSARTAALASPCTRHDLTGEKVMENSFSGSMCPRPPYAVPIRTHGYSSGATSWAASSTNIEPW